MYYLSQSARKKSSACMHVYSVFFFQDLPLVKSFSKVLLFANDRVQKPPRYNYSLVAKTLHRLSKSVSSFERPFNLLEHAAKLTLLPYWEIQIGI
jgi:hypothetical protein